MVWHTRAANGGRSADDRRGRGRLVLLSLLLVLATAAAGTPAVAAPSGADDRARHGDHRRPVVRNRPPVTPPDVGTSEPVSACASRRAPAPLRSRTPWLWATLADPDGGAVRGVFAVHDARTGRRVWGPVTTTPQGSGSSHVVGVPDGVLVDGSSYQWRVSARDDRGRRSGTVRCSVVVDVTAPGMPSVTAVAGTAPAVYAEDAVAGGVGVPGELRFEGDGSRDVVRFHYSLNGSMEEVPVDAGSTGATITVVPTTSGPQQLTVQAVDSAGNVGEQRSYRFVVAFAPVGAAWLLDEGTGTRAADSGPGGDVNPLTLQGATRWGAGPLGELGFDPTDGALLFGGIGDAATTAGPALDTASSYSVLTFARLDATGTTATAVSQDGAGGPVFSVGHRAGGDCPDGLATCWAFAVADGDSVEAPRTVATSSVPVRAGSWVLLAAVHDAAAGTVRLDVCEIGSAAEPGAGVAVRGAEVPTAGAWRSAGPVRLGGALRDRAPAEPWPGAIGSVSVRAGVVEDGTVRRRCTLGVA